MAGPDTPACQVSPLATPTTPSRAVGQQDDKEDKDKKETEAMVPPQVDRDDTPSVTSTTPPDGGWGWVVVFASFMIHIIADGITYSFGIFMVELIDVFEAGHGAASLIPSILVGVTLGSGPIASAFTNRYGCRWATIAGAVLGATGLVLSTLANSITLLYFTIGICTGLGFGLIYLPAIVSVSMYFEKKRAFATGIAVCGSGLGTFIMAPVTKGLINELGWKGAFLVTAALVLCCVIFGALFRPLGSSEPSIKKKRDTPEEKRQLTKCSAETEQEPCCEKLNPPEVMVNGKTVSAMRPFAQQMGADGGKYSDIARMAMSHPAFLNQAERPQVHFGSHSQFQELKRRNQQGLVLPHESGIMGRKDILYGGSLLNIPEYKSNPRQYSRNVSRSMRLHDDEDLFSVNSLEREETTCGCVGDSSPQGRAFNQMLDFTLFKDPIFMVYAVSNFLTSIGFNVPYIYTVDRAVVLGLDEKNATFLLSVVGIANTIGRIFLGWISDKGWVNRFYLYVFCISLCGLVVCLSVFFPTYPSQALYCAVFGVTSGAYVGLTSVVLVDLLGLDKLTKAFGLLLLFQGVASVMGPPIIGALYDSIGNYDAGFYFAGGMIFLSGIILLAIPYLQKRKERMKKPTFSIHSNGINV